MVHSNSSPARPISRSLRSIRFLPDPQWNPSAKVAGAACPQLITSIFSGRCGRCLASAPVVAILARSTRPRLKRPLVVCNVARHEEMCEIPRTTLDTHTHTIYGSVAKPWFRYTPETRPRAKLREESINLVGILIFAAFCVMEIYIMFCFTSDILYGCFFSIEILTVC